MNNKPVSREKYERRKAWGLETSIDLFDCNPEAIRESGRIKEYCIKLCKLIDMKRFGEPVIVRFGEDPKVQGYSLMQLIETSSITGHFAEDNNSAYIDIFSCKYYEQEKAVEFSKNFFKAKEASFNVIIRGRGIA